MVRRILLTVVTALAVCVAFVGAARQRAVRNIPAPPVVGPTFSNEIVRIFQQHCQSCHHPGDIAPFSLMDYQSAKPYALQIKFMTQTRQMPPWKAAAGCGDFAEARRMGQSEIDTIASWVDKGAAEGNPADLPAPLNFDSGWALGEPDLVGSYTDSYTPKASGDTYRCFPIPTDSTDVRWVSAIDIHPGDRQTVHHVIAFLDTTGASETLDRADPAPGYTCFGGPGFEPTSDATLGGWAPGARASLLPETVAFKLPAKVRIVLQVHYHPHTSAPQADRTEIGIYFAKKQPEKQMYILPVWNRTFTIPPNDPNYKVEAAFPFPTPFATHIWLVAPHMHLLGRKMKVEMTPSGGTSQCLINIEDWDFNWQGMYRYKEPIAVPPGARLSATAFYDNSADNWRNPNIPPKPVSWGEETTDEMCIAFLGVTFDGDNLALGIKGDASWIPTMF
jgi:hypothetical protein